MADTKTRHNEKSWREYIVDNVGLGIPQHADFDDTNPNYAIISNPCDSPLYVSTSPKVSDTVADLVIPPKGRQIYAQMHGMRELHFMCYDGTPHSVTVKTWEGEFSPSAIPQSQQFSVVDEKQSLGTVEVSNLPNVQTVAVNNIPAVQTVSVNNMPAKQNVSVADPLPSGTNNIGAVNLVAPSNGGSMTISSTAASNDSTSETIAGLYTVGYQQAFNGVKWDRWRNNLEGVLLPSSARTTGATSAMQTNYNAKGIMIILDVTAVPASVGTGGISPTIYSKDSISGKAIKLTLDATKITAVGTYAYILYPGITERSITTGSNNIQQTTNCLLPRSYHAYVNALDAQSYTYSLSYSLIL